MKAHLPKHPTRLYLIRHGEVEERYHRIFGGSRIDMNLSDLGHQHAQALAEWFERGSLDAVYTSPMQRVRQTAAALLRQLELTPTEMTDLREVDFGDWTGFRWHEIREKFGVVAYNWLETLENGGLPNGESAAGLSARELWGRNSGDRHFWEDAQTF